MAATRHGLQLYGGVALGGLPVAVVKTVTDVAGLHFLSGGIVEVERKGLLVVEQYLLGQVAGQHLAARAKGYGRAAGARLAGLVGDVGLHHKLVEHGVLLRAAGHREGHVNHETAVAAGGQLAPCHLAVVVAVTVGPLAPVVGIGEPPVGHAAPDAVLHRGALHADAGIRACLPRHGQRVAGPVVGLHVVEEHFIGGALVFLHAEGLACAGRLHGVAAVQLSGGQYELGRCLAVLVGGDGLFFNHLMVGIAQPQGQPAAFHALRLNEAAGLVDDGCHVDGLPRAVDAAVGIEVDGGFPVVVAIVAVVAVQTDGVEAVVVLGRGEHLIRVALGLRVVEQLALLVAAVGFPYLFGPVPRLQRGTADGLSRLAVHHHEARLVAGLCLADDGEVAHVEQPAQHHRLAILEPVRLPRELEHVDAGGQVANGHGVAKLLVGLMTAVPALLRQLGQRREPVLQLGKVLVARHRGLFVARQVGLADAQRQLAEVAQVVQLHLLLLCGAQQLVLHAHVELRARHFQLGIAQHVHGRPLGPASHRLVNVGIALGLRGTAVVVHVVIALKGQLCRHVQVAILPDERVNLLYVWRLLPLAIRAVLPQLPECRQAGRRAVAGADVVAVGHFIVVQRAADEAQQVVAEAAAAVAVGHQRVEGPGLGLCQQHGVGQCHGAVLLLALAGRVAEPPVVLVVDSAQHGGIDGTQAFVSGAAQLLLHAAHHGLQRVGRYAHLHVGNGEPRLQQVAPLLVAEGFDGYLLRLVNHLLGQVLLVGLLQLFPHLLVTLSKHRHRHSHYTDERNE